MSDGSENAPERSRTPFLDRLLRQSDDAAEAKFGVRPNGTDTPERCVHAVDGPDWAGLRELSNAEVDPWEGFTGQSEADAADAAITDPLLKRIHELAVENEKLRDQIDAARDSAAKKGWNLRNDRDEWRSIALRERAEAAALQARLDAMTIEYLPGMLRQRLVGPWAVVPEGDTNA